MENSNADTEHICHQFDAFCRKNVRDERKTYMADKAKRRDSEVLFSDLTDAQELLISLTDEYPSEQFCFVVQDHEIFIHDSQLAEMLGKLPEEKRDPLLLTYWFGMRDQEIADFPAEADPLHLCGGKGIGSRLDDIEQRTDFQIKRLRDALTVRVDNRQILRKFRLMSCDKVKAVRLQNRKQENNGGSPNRACNLTVPCLRKRLSF